MSRCDLSISFDARQSEYRLGDRVTGNVQLDVSKDVSKQSLRVTLGWRTHGRGNVASDEVASVTLYEGPLQAGSGRTLPFELTLPKQGPFTYHGKVLNVDWHVEARCDIPWARDPRTSEDVLVVPEDGTPRVKRPDGGQARDWSQSPKMLVAFGAVLMITGLGLYGFSDGNWQHRMVAAFFFVGGLAMVGSPVVRKIASRRTGDVRFELGEVTAHDELGCSVSFLPSGSAQINGVSARLEIEEKVTRGSGTNRRTYTDQIYTQSVEMAAAGRGPHGIVHSARLPFPRPLLYSFAATDNALNWKIVVQIDVAGWPDWRQSFPVWVSPPAASAG